MAKIKITEEMVNRVGICDYDEIKYHQTLSHTTPLEETIIEVVNGNLPVLSRRNERWDIYREGNFYFKVKNRRELFIELSNIDLGAYFDEGCLGLYEYISNINKDIFKIAYIKVELKKNKKIT